MTPTRSPPLLNHLFVIASPRLGLALYRADFPFILDLALAALLLDQALHSPAGFAPTCKASCSLCSSLAFDFPFSVPASARLVYSYYTKFTIVSPFISKTQPATLTDRSSRPFILPLVFHVSLTLDATPSDVIWSQTRRVYRTVRVSYCTFEFSALVLRPNPLSPSLYLKASALAPECNFPLGFSL